MEDAISMLSRVSVQAKLNVATQLIRDCSKSIALDEAQVSRLRTIEDDLTEFTTELHWLNLDTESTLQELLNAK